MEALAATGDFAPPRMETLEAAMEHGLGLKRGRVFADLWDLEKFSNCGECFAARRQRLQEMNHRQVVIARTGCHVCGGN
jgi:hypothetical protein